MKQDDLYTRSFRGEDGFNEFVQSLGGDPIAVTKASGLAPSLPKGLVNFESFAGTCTLFEEGALQTNEPEFGLKWALHQPNDFRFSGPHVFLLSLAKNVREWVDMAIDYQKIHSNGFSYSYEENLTDHEVVGVIAIHPLAPPCKHLLEQFTAGLALLGRHFLPGFKLKRVTFQHSPPENMTLYEDIFQCPVFFNADRNTVVIDFHYFAVTKTAFLTKFAKPFIKQYLSWQLAKHSKAEQSIAMMVTETIPIILGVKGSDIKHVSHALNIHPKKLQRLLKDEGKNFSDILDGVRKSIAIRLLIESDISIERLAKMLDYSSDKPFTRAAKRWLGMTPTEYRKQASLKAER